MNTQAAILLFLAEGFFGNRRRLSIGLLCDRRSEFVGKLHLVGCDEISVRGEFGKPDFNESFMRKGKEFVVLYYRTRHVESDGITTKDETTPLVFVDGALVGWGESALENATAN